MKSACLPEGADIVVPEQRKDLFGDKYFSGVPVVPYTLQFDTSPLTFDGGVGSSSQSVTASVEGLEGVVLDVTVDGSSVTVEKSSNGSYEVTPVACGDSKINVGLSFEGFDLPVIYGTRAATVNHVEDEGAVTVEPTYASEGKKEYRCKHCKTLLRTETVAKLDNIFEEGGVAYGQVGANSVEVIKSGTDQNANPLYADKDVVIPSQITHGGKTYKVAGIGKSAFNPLSNSQELG